MKGVGIHNDSKGIGRCLISFFIYLLSCHSVQRNQQKKTVIIGNRSDSSTYVYRFGNKYLDIDKLKFLDSNLPKNIIEIDSLRFDTNTAYYKGRRFKLLENGDIVITSIRKYVKTISNKASFDNHNYISVICSISDGIVHILCLANGYHIRKYNEEGVLQNDWVLKDIPFLSFFTSTNNEIIFSGIYSDIKATIELNTVTGLQKKLNVATAGIITSPTTDSLIGTFYVTKNQKHLFAEIKNKKWEIDSDYSEDEIKTLLKDSTLIIVKYPAISCGCSVIAYNINTGNLLWKGDLDQISVTHSAYSNVVYATLFHDKIIIEGVESAGSYLQMLDFKTGKRLFESMPLISPYVK